ncbi:hypothetical protein [Nonomuraea dietziae]
MSERALAWPHQFERLRIRNEHQTIPLDLLDLARGLVCPHRLRTAG